MLGGIVSLEGFLEVREDPTGTLFHYTSLPNLPSILKSKTLWATDVQYMNDAQELRHGMSVLEEVIDSRLPELAGKQKKCAEQLRRWNAAGSLTQHHIFVACFTEKGNLLSQWRSYCVPGKGVSIGFAADEIIESVYSQGFRLTRVYYQREEQVTLMRYFLDTLLESADDYEEPDAQKKHPAQTFYPLFGEWVDTFAYLCAMMKHNAFSEESEWRAISAPIQDLRDPRFRFRDAPIGLTPYIELGLPRNASQSVSFDAVFLGPAPNHNLAFRSLGTLITTMQATVRSGIAACQIPLRT